MRKIAVIIQREYLSRVKKKSFLITTILAPLGMIVLLFSTVIIQKMGNEPLQIGIVDESGLFSNTAFADAPDGSYYFHKTSSPTIVTDFSTKKTNNFDALLIIPKDFSPAKPENPAISFISIKKTGMMVQEKINQLFSAKIKSLQIAELGLSAEQGEQLSTAVKINFQKLDSNDKSGAMLAAVGIGYGVGFLIYIVLILYGTMILKGVMEEKTSRIMEVLASSVKPIQLMLGKIIGVAFVGLTQFAIWGILFFIIQVALLPAVGFADVQPQQVQHLQSNSFDADDIAGFMQELSAIDFTKVVWVAVFYFLGGYLLYGSLFAAVGAAVGEESDSQSLTMPVMLPIIFSMIILIQVLQDPEGNLAFWASLFPFTSPIVMPSLVAFNPPWWQLLLSMILLVGGFVGCAYVAAKVYRTGMLLYGKKPTYKEIFKWIIAKNG